LWFSFALTVSSPGSIARVRQQNGIDPRRIEGKRAEVELLLAFRALKHAAVDHDPVIGNVESEAGAGHRSGCAIEG
jgi:hypothetical protein